MIKNKKQLLKQIHKDIESLQLMNKKFNIIDDKLQEIKLLENLKNISE